MEQYRDIFKAIESRDAGAVDAFLAEGVDPDHRDARGWTPLLKALAIEEGDLVRILLERGAGVHPTGPVQETPLHVAAATGDARSVEMLLAAGADVHAQALVGGTPLHAAAAGGSVAVARLLLSAGADLEARGPGGETPLHYAALCAVAVWRKLCGRLHSAAPFYTVLRDALGAKVEYGIERTVHMCRFLLDRGAQPVPQDTEGRTPLDWAGPLGRESLEGLLLRAAGVAMLRVGFLRRGEGRQITSAVLTVRPDTSCGEVARKAASRFGVPARLEWALCPMGAPRRKVESYVSIHDAVQRANPFLESVSPTAYDDVIRLGRYFAFCPQVEGVDRDFLRSLGIAAVPAVLPRVSTLQSRPGELDLRLQPFSKQVEFHPLAVISPACTRHVAGEPVRALVLCLGPGAPARGVVHVRLTSMREEVASSRRDVRLRRGLGAVTWEGLPEGDYTAVLSWNGTEALCHFTVGSGTGEAAMGTWCEGPSLDDQGSWRGRALLLQYGVPLSEDTEVNVGLVAEAPPQPAEAWTRTSAEGIVDVRLAATHADCGGVRFSWRDGREHSALLPLPGGDSIQQGCARVTAWPHAGSAPVAGMHVSACGVGGRFPLEMREPLGERPSWTALRDLDVVAVTTIFPGAPSATRTFPGVRAGDEITVDLPPGGGHHGYLCVGAMEGRETFEQATPFFRAVPIAVECVMPASVASGRPVRLGVRVRGARQATLAICVRERNGAGGPGLEAGVAAAGLQNLRDEIRSLEGPLPMRFSDHYLDGLFHLQESEPPAPRAGAASPCGLRARATLSASGGAARAASLDGGASLLDAAPHRVFKPVEARGVDVGEVPGGGVLFAGVVETRTGHVEVKLDVPGREACYGVQVLAIGGESPSLATGGCEFSARPEIAIDLESFPRWVHSRDAGVVMGSLGVASRVGPAHWEATTDGTLLESTDPEGAPLLQGVVAPPDDGWARIHLPVWPGTYRVSARAGRFAATERFVVQAADGAEEPRQQWVVLRQGQGIDLAAWLGVRRVRFASSGNEVFRACGLALAGSPWRGTEQVAAAMIGSWTTFLAGDRSQAHVALGRLRRGIALLEQAWRVGGFAAYPGQEAPCPLTGMRTYRHLATMARLRRWLMPVPGLRADVSVILERVLELLSRAEGVYGLLATTPSSCEEAWLALESRATREVALRFVEDRWRACDGVRGVRGVVEGSGSAVLDRTETCLAAAVLMEDADRREARGEEILGTLDWLGSQLTAEGRPHGTRDSVALLVLMARARELFERGVVQVGDGPPAAVADAGGLEEDRLSSHVRCLEGPVLLVVDVETAGGACAPLDSAGLRAWLEGEGRMLQGGASVGQRLDLVLEAEEAGPGRYAHIVLPPCLVLDEDGGCCTNFTRDFEGGARLRIPLRARIPTGDRPWHGVLILRDMEDEEWRRTLEIAVTVHS